jgi:Fe-S oxidoreductase
MGIDLETNCCGLAGNFGFEDGHFEISTKIAERSILRRIDAVNATSGPTDSICVVADGYSCRTQISELSNERPKHIAEVLRDVLRRSPLKDDR